MLHHAPIPTPARPRLIRALVVAIAAVGALLGTALPTTSASAAEIPAAITHVSTNKTTYGYNEKLTLDFDWAVIDDAVAGDTFTLDLPKELKANTMAKFTLRSADGVVVANATWNGKLVTFTLTDYVDTHDSVSGHGFLTVQWDHAFTPETSAPIVLEFESNAVEVVIGDKPAPNPPCTQNCPPPAATPTSRTLSKSGGWADGAYEGTRDADGNINWAVRLPGSDTGFAGPVEIADAPAAGSIIECGTLTLTTQFTLEGAAVKRPVDATRYSLTCTPTQFAIILDTIAPTEFITVAYKGTITDQASGVYGNRVTLTIAGVTTEKETIIRRQDAGGGTGGGVQTVSVGDYVWLDANRDGMQDADEHGIPGVTLSLVGPTGAPGSSTVTDASGRYSFDGLPPLPAGQHYTVVLDLGQSATALAGLEPTRAGSTDRGNDSSTLRAESTDLITNGARDATLDFGFMARELPTLPVPGPSTPVVSALAYTGGPDPLPLVAGGGALVLVGALAMLASRRRRA